MKSFCVWEIMTKDDRINGKNALTPPNLWGSCIYILWTFILTNLIDKLVYCDK